MKEIWNKLAPEGRQLLLCLLTVLALTLFARGFAGAAQAQVAVSAPQSRTLSEDFHTTGTLTPLGTNLYAIPAGLVTEDPVKIGTRLESGDTVAMVNADALDELLTRKSAEATQLRLRIESLLEDNTPSSDGVTAAKEAVSDAKAIRTQCKEALAAALEEQAVLEATQRLEEAEEALKDAKALLQREEASYAEAEVEARRERESNEAEASVLQLDLDRLNAELAELEKVREDGYALTAPAAGVLAEFSDTQFSMTNPYGGNLLTFTLDAEEASYLTARTKITITREEQQEELSGCVKTEDGSGFAVPLVKAGWEPGTVLVSGMLWEEPYDTCVPIWALRRDAGGYFLFVLERRTTILRMEQTVRKVYVYPERMDGSWAAVSGLEPGVQVVESSSKPLTEGSRVRVTP